MRTFATPPPAPRMWHARCLYRGPRSGQVARLEELSEGEAGIDPHRLPASRSGRHIQKLEIMMIKNRIATAFAFVGLIGLAACGTDRDTDVIVEQPVVEEPAPVVTEPMQPVVTDTMEWDDTTVVEDTTVQM
jgi:hypothetical protein